jgi:hypothetical protein
MLGCAYAQLTPTQQGTILEEGEHGIVLHTPELGTILGLASCLENVYLPKRKHL